MIFQRIVWLPRSRPKCLNRGFDTNSQSCIYSTLLLPVLPAVLRYQRSEIDSTLTLLGLSSCRPCLNQSANWSVYKFVLLALSLANCHICLYPRLGRWSGFFAWSSWQFWPLFSLIDATGDSRLVGDVEFHTAVQRAGWITPVPGGVGPVCVAILLRNTLNSTKRFLHLRTHNPIPDMSCYWMCVSSVLIYNLPFKLTSKPLFFNQCRNNPFI